MNATLPQAPQPSFAELFTPKLVTVFREGYDWRHLRADALAGLTVAIVALPLSMAIAIASGASPAQGLYAAIVGGFLVSALAGVLAVVAWNMVERHAVATLLKSSRGDAAVFVVTFLLTILVGLTEAIVVGFALGSILFIHRMAQTTAIAAHVPFAEDADRADGARAQRRPYDESLAADPDVVVYRITGAFFFGAAAAVGAVLDRISPRHRALIVDLSAVSFLDATAANTLSGLARKAAKRRVRVVLTGANREVREELLVYGVEPPLVDYERSIDAALEELEKAGDPLRSPAPSKD